MGIIETAEWSCDLCHASSKATSSTEGPEGWVKITVEDSMVSRMFYDKVICKSCLKEIEAAKIKMFASPKKIFGRSGVLA